MVSINMIIICLFIYKTNLESVDKNKEERENMKTDEPVKIVLLWSFVIFFISGHISAIYGLYLIFTSAKLFTTIFGELIYSITFYLDI